MDEELQADLPPAQSAPAAMFAAGRWACRGRAQSEHRREGWQREVLQVSGLQASMCSSQLSAFQPPNLPALLAPACQPYAHKAPVPALLAPHRSAAGPWSKLGSFEQSRKENTQRPGVWAGQKMRQAPAHSAPPAPALEILVDPEFEEEQQEQQEGDQVGGWWNAPARSFCPVHGG